MSCSCCNHDPCCCPPANCADLHSVECVDPGILTDGRFGYVLDYKLCPKRLASPEANSMMVANVAGSGQISVSWTDSPCIALPTLEIAEGQAIGNILAALGDSSCWRRIVPAAGADGFLGANNGEWVIKDIPEASIPDPLEVSTLTVTTLATVVSLVLTSSLCFPAAPTGTIASVIGLDADGCLVKQASSGGGGGSTPSILALSTAVYYENPTESSTATPNNSIANGAYATIGNEIYNNNAISQISGADTIKINVAGEYFVYWQGSFAEPPSTSNGIKQLDLEINGATTILGSRSQFSATNPIRSASVQGVTAKSFAANDVLRLKVSGSATNNRLQGAKLILVKFA